MSRLRCSAVAVPLWAVFALAGLGCSSGRLSADEFELISQVLQLKPGIKVADVGAGDGSWSVELARAVGDRGHVWATEIKADDVEEIERRIGEESISNITPILGTAEDSGLPAACCDAMLLRLVYHHFVEPESMLRSLFEGLREGGYLAVVEVRPENSWPELDDVPDRGGHGIEPEALERELSAAGFVLVEHFDVWNGDDLRYCSVFRRQSG